MNAESYSSFIQHHNAYEAKALKILLKEFRKILKSINYNNLTFDNAEALITLNIKEGDLQKALYKVHYTIGKSYGNFIARQLRADNPIQEKKWKPLPLFSDAFQQFLIAFYLRNGGELIKTLTETLVAQVVREIRNSTYENETVIQMRDRIFKTVNKPNFYKWQAMRIARTETTFAMNSAKEIAGEVSGVVLEKIWLGKNDGRERPSHIAMNNKTVGQNEMFNVGGVQMKYPGDKENGTAAETINCRCTFGYKAKRDENGRLIFTD